MKLIYLVMTMTLANGQTLPPTQKPQSYATPQRCLHFRDIQREQFEKAKQPGMKIVIDCQTATGRIIEWSDVPEDHRPAGKK